MSLPPPLMTSDEGSFARSTIVERKPAIIRQVLADNDYPADIVAALEDFRGEIAGRSLQPLCEAAPDVDEWNAELERYQGHTWLEIPWYFAEAFFYRRLLEAVRYFQRGPWQGHNPFAAQKLRQMEAEVGRLSAEWDDLFALPPEMAFEALVYSSLWGNRADLSNFTVKEQVRSGLSARLESRNVLIDHTPVVQAALSAGVKRVDFISDNVGSDVLFDLALADFLLGKGWSRKVVFHLKGQPFFVSDAMVEDVHTMLDLLSKGQTPAGRGLASRLKAALRNGGLELRVHPFWTSWKMFRQMPDELRDELGQADLVVLKGDVNYRRLLDDRHWPPTTRMEDAAGYFPASLVALRTLKGEIIVGLRPGQAEALSAADPTWMINGKRGVIHYMKIADKEH
jgi:hypothetical protein